MQDKQKVTLYLPPELHRQLKIQAAVDAESMSALVEKAIDFYLNNSQIVEEVLAERHGRTYQVHTCPECSTPMVLREGEMISLKQQPSIIPDDLTLAESLKESHPASEELVPC